MHKTKIAVIMGGKSAEYDVSLNSGLNISLYFDKKKYDIYPLIITKDGIWHFMESHVPENISLPDLQEKWKELEKSNGMPPEGILGIVKSTVDLVFLALHGPYGEDGCIQGLFEVIGIPYTGSDVLSSALGMDKIRFKRLMTINNLPVADDIVIRESDWKSGKINARMLIDQLDLPLVCKSPKLGSSIGLGIAFDEEEINPMIDRIFSYDDIIMVEQYIKGREITCGVLADKNKLAALPIIELVPKESKYFDYKAKYIAGATDEICPAKIPQYIKEKAEEYAVKVHLITGCGDLSRTDMIFMNDDLYILETNTIPGMTRTSLIPQAAAVYGMSFSQLVDHIAQNAIWRSDKRKSNLNM